MTQRCSRSDVTAASATSHARQRINEGGLGWHAVEHGLHEEPIRDGEIGERPQSWQIQDRGVPNGVTF